MRKGFAHPIILVLVVLLILAVLGGVYLWKNQSNNKLSLPVKVPIEALALPTPTPTPSSWKTYKNNQYGFELIYPKEGVIVTDKGNIEGECGQSIKESGGKIDVDNVFQVKIMDWSGTIQDYLISKGAGKIYNTEVIEGTGADEGMYLVELKKDFEIAVGYPPLLYVKYLFKKGNNLIIVSTFLHPENMGGCINPEVIDPIKYKKYLDLGWDPKNSFKFLPIPNQNSTEMFCGGFAGKLCPTGYVCQLDGNYPDASGKCVKN